MIEVAKYAKAKGISISDVMEMIRSAQIKGVEENGLWYVKTSERIYERPASVGALYFLAVLSIVCGLIIIALVTPAPSYMTTMSDYIPAFIWGIAAVIECTLFVALAQIIDFTAMIAFNTIKKD